MECQGLCLFDLLQATVFGHQPQVLSRTNLAYRGHYHLANAPRYGPYQTRQEQGNNKRLWIAGTGGFVRQPHLDSRFRVRCPRFGPGVWSVEDELQSIN